LPAGLQAGATADTTILAEYSFREWGLALGIVAPLAIQRTTLKEHRGADARAIVDGKPLYIENESLDQCRPLACMERVP